MNQRTRLLIWSLAIYLVVLATGSDFAQKSPGKTSGPATGTIVVYRTWKFSGGGRSLPVILDGQPRIKLENGRYWAFVVSPGDHALLRTGDFGVKDKIQVHVESSQTVYVDAHYGGWATIFEVAEDQDEARQQVAKLKQQTSTR